MSFILSKRILVVAFVLCFIFPVAQAQAIWELGAKGGTDFYLGDRNSAIFNKIQPVLGLYVRKNQNPRWVTKVQFASGRIDSPMEQNYVDFSLQEEFNFFEYGLLNSESWTRFFSPYICVGVGLSLFTGVSDESIFTPNMPFGVGVKWKVLKHVNIGLEWTMHKLFSDKFDYVDDPYKINGTSYTKRDWYSMCTLMVGFDLGNRSSYCR